MALADIQYLPSDLLLLNFSRLYQLLNDVPNFYSTRNVNSIWGRVLQAISEEIARADYWYSYDIFSKDPTYLTPADIKRQFSTLLHISRNYPTSSQTDIDYKNLLTALIAAYLEGSTLSGLQAVAQAYVGSFGVKVEELYNNPFYDKTYRNTLLVSANLPSSATNTEIQNFTSDLYTALALGKPAHVGIDIVLILGVDDDLSSYSGGIEDTLKIIMQQSENPPLELGLYLAPKEENTNNTTLATPGNLLAPVITQTQYQALPGKPSYASPLSPTLQSAYIPVPNSTNYTLLSAASNWVMVLDANGNPTGEVANWDTNYVEGILAPNIDQVWEVQEDSVKFIVLD